MYKTIINLFYFLLINSAESNCKSLLVDVDTASNKVVPFEF